MIETSFQEVHSKEWIEQNISDPTNELVILRQVLPWQKIIDSLKHFYSIGQGRFGKNIRIMVALVVLGKLRHLSDRQVIAQTKENRYFQYFCNVPDQGLACFLHHSTLHDFRQRIGPLGASLLEEGVFEWLHRSGAIDNDAALIDSSVLSNNIVYPNDVQLIYKAFEKMTSFARALEIPLWWDHDHLKKRWRAFNRDQKKNRAEYLKEFAALWAPALKAFKRLSRKLEEPSQKKQLKTYWRFLNYSKLKLSKNSMEKSRLRIALFL